MMCSKVPSLIIIDLQNDFTSPDGPLRRKSIPFGPIVSALKPICEIFYSQKWPIIAIRSEYTGAAIVDDAEDKIGSADGHLAGTHTGKRKFCQPGTLGAEFHPDAQALFDACDAVVITKTQYSAFTDTSLHAYLQSQNINAGTLYFAGVTANNCVLASLTSAFGLGYKVRAIEECVGATSPHLLESTFKKIGLYYGDVVSASDITISALVAEAEKPRRILYWVSGSIPSWRVMLALSRKNLPYTQKRLRVMTAPKQTRSEEFLAINPRGKTPTLIDVDGSVVIESMAILQYLETFYPSIPLMAPVAQKAEYTLALQRFHESENLHNVFEDIELLFFDYSKQPHYKTRICDAYTNTIRELGFWERYLSKTKYVAGEEFGIADCAFYPNVAYLVHRGLDLDGEGFPKLKEYVEFVGKMDCVKDALPVGWEKPGKNLFKKIPDLLKIING